MYHDGRECAVGEVVAEYSLLEASENQLFSEAHLQSLGSEDLKTFPTLYILYSHLSLCSLSLLEKCSKSSSLHAPTFRSQEVFAVRLEAKSLLESLLVSRHPRIHKPVSLSADAQNLQGCGGG